MKTPRKQVITIPRGVGATTLQKLRPDAYVELTELMTEAGLPSDTLPSELDEKTLHRLAKRVDEARASRAVLTSLPSLELRPLSLSPDVVLAPEERNYWNYLTNARSHHVFNSPKEALKHYQAVTDGAAVQHLQLGQYPFHYLHNGSKETL